MGNGIWHMEIPYVSIKHGLGQARYSLCLLKLIPWKGENEVNHITTCKTISKIVTKEIEPWIPNESSGVEFG